MAWNHYYQRHNNIYCEVVDERSCFIILLRVFDFFIVSSALQDHPGSETSDTEGKVKGQKRKRSINFESPYYEKRRSARVGKYMF